EEGHWNQNAGGLTSSVADSTTHEDQRYGRDVRDLSLGRLASAVPRRHMCDFVGHGSSEFSFAFGMLDQPSIDEKMSAGKSKSIDGIVFNDLDGKREL